MNIKKYHYSIQKKWNVLIFLIVAIVTTAWTTGQIFQFFFYAQTSSDIFALESSEEKRELERTHKWPIASNESVRYIQQSIQYIEHFDSLLTEMELSVNLFDEKYIGIGKYQEKWDHQTAILLPQTNININQSNTTGNLESILRSNQRTFSNPLQKTLFRLHIKMFRQNSRASHEDSDDNILEIVCDKDQRTLWTYTSIEGSKNLTQINLEDLGDALSRLNDNERNVLTNKNVQLPCFMSGLPGLGGISGMLKQLLNCYEFNDKAEKMFFNNGEVPVWKLNGQLKKQYREQYEKQLLEGIKENDSIRFELLEIVPSHVEIYLGCDSPFPYRLKYFSQTGKKRVVPKQLLTLDFKKIHINTSLVREDDFIYRPPYLNHERVNERYLQQLIPQIEF